MIDRFIATLRAMQAALHYLPLQVDVQYHFLNLYFPERLSGLDRIVRAVAAKDLRSMIQFTGLCYMLLVIIEASGVVGGDWL
jgi:hypothetical protein